MNGVREGAFLLPTAPPRLGQRRLALTIAVLLLLVFIVTMPFGSIQLPGSVAFVTGFQTILFVNDLITATVLFAHFSILRRRSLLALASGYLFTSLIAVPYAVAFPGVIWTAGFGQHTSGWLYLFWHGGLPLAVIVYLYQNSADRGINMISVSTRTGTLQRSEAAGDVLTKLHHAVVAFGLMLVNGTVGSRRKRNVSSLRLRAASGDCARLCVQ